MVNRLLDRHEVVTDNGDVCCCCCWSNELTNAVLARRGEEKTIGASDGYLLAE